jgi:hypothetical protein
MCGQEEGEGSRFAPLRKRLSKTHSNPRLLIIVAPIATAFAIAKKANAVETPQKYRK